jgi:CRP-like cAMP-binding protein
MTEKTKLEILKASPLARELNDKECEALAALITLHELKDGEVLLREGQSDNNLYVVVSGEIAVSRQDEKGNWSTLHALMPGDLVGELSFMDNEPRYAALRAVGASRVFSLNREKFETLLDSHPRVVYKTMRAIMRVVHAIQRRLSMNLVELQNYIYKVHGKY